MRNIIEKDLLEIIGHLGAALIQQAPSDDQIIMGHVRDANDIATKLYREIRATDTAHDGQVAENTKLRDLCERLKLEAKIHAGEARGANKTIREAYQAVTGCTGEPANWNGAGPIKKEISRLPAELAEAVELLHRMIQDFHPFTSKRTSRSRFSDQLEGDREMSKQGRRAHVKRAKHFQAHRHSYVWTYSPPVFVIVIRGEQSVMIRGAARKLINRAHAIRGGYQS